MNRQERHVQERREYIKEETQKLASYARTVEGHSTERDPYPELGNTYWKRREALNDFIAGAKNGE
jgi:hypothetical protein